MTQPRLLGGRYELDGVIGRGGMAEVYRARDLRLDRIVAIKTLRADLARDPTFQARFRREAQSAASLNHPSVIAVYDTGEDLIDGSPIPYIVMEYVEGRTLRDVLRDEHRLSPERAMEMTDGILRALDYSHRGGIVHRDIKPANVMLTSGGEVKVMDFGIARALADSAATMTATAQVIGTAQYLSPEQARGERVDARSDLYSTGCVLFELLTGRPPFQGDSPVAIAYQHVREEPPAPSQIDPSIPRWADAIVLKALTKDPNYRYQSAAEMRADIQRALQGMPVAAPTMAMNGGTQVMQGGPPTQGTRPATMGYDLPPVHYTEPEEPEGRGKKIALGVVVALLAVGAVTALFFMFKGGGAPKDPNTVAIPTGIVGNDQDSAKQQLTDLGFTKITTKKKSSDSVDSGKVISVSPNENTKIDKAQVATTEVTLVVSTGKPKVTVPRVRGLSEDDAKNAIENANLKVGNTDKQNSSSVPKGYVISSDPDSGSKVAEGTEINLIISDGPGKTTVPSEVGKQVSDAKADLRSNGFGVRVTYVDAQNGEAPGTVVDQNPGQGETANRGSTVTLMVTRQQTQQPPPDQPSTSPSQPGKGGWPGF
ncbi:Stk1 family PASTA domain-containing Ser/Thr kinase [Actinoallomurus rhizosphaericola]|uniref:Stk1 family PASTA domain-containing Ser/Thr kinase n=1 Tax=Actinoallomurus rhizosphaericola TaxID=2952536 RepID=UPI0020937928|nr:Stk1 family PASTA domain-containing Ser/Thr kinase [Actinoallomurus rhizosphaericola]MCO5998592.1 Stk1 family PASTA domain-containing Ser/Thr kinase [Actinoallomurus rhizosphaericola]